jgi:hypothetical protein
MPFTDQQRATLETIEVAKRKGEQEYDRLNRVLTALHAWDAGEEHPLIPAGMTAAEVITLGLAAYRPRRVAIRAAADALPDL